MAILQAIKNWRWKWPYCKRSKTGGGNGLQGTRLAIQAILLWISIFQLNLSHVLCCFGSSVGRVLVIKLMVMGSNPSRGSKVNLCWLEQLFIGSNIIHHFTPIGPGLYGLRRSIVCIPPDVPSTTDYCFCEGLPEICKAVLTYYSCCCHSTYAINHAPT